MKRFSTFFFFLIASAFVCGCGNSQSEKSGDYPGKSLLKYVNPLLATGGYGDWAVGSEIPGASAPFGMIKVSPDTKGETETTSQTHCAGYFYDDKYIAGFSQLHFSGTGVPDYGSLLITPTLSREEADLFDGAYKSEYKKQTEKASPGYYAVTLKNEINVELTATERVAYHRYAFPVSPNPNNCVVIDAGHSLPTGLVKNSDLTYDPATGEFYGFIDQLAGLSGGYGGFTVYFYGKFNAASDYNATWDKGYSLEAGSGHCSGSMVCAALICFSQARAVEAQVSVSYVSVENAKQNFAAETVGASFDSVKAKTEKKWGKILSNFEVNGGSEDDLTMFYTAIYRIFQMPTMQTDVSGEFMGFDDKPRKADWGLYYSDFSLWDTYRSFHPFMTLFFPSIQSEFVYSLIAQAESGGYNYFPKWSLANGETNCMVGTPAEIVIADSYLKGIDFPHEKAFSYALNTAIRPTAKYSGYIGRELFDYYNDLGYVPDDKTAGSVSKTQEYAYADNALCNMAKALGKTEKETLCKNRDNYKNLWSAKKKFFLPKKSDGNFVFEGDWSPENIEPFGGAFSKAYVEGNAWQYLFYPYFDAASLIELFGGKDEFVKALTDLYEKSIIEDELFKNDKKIRGNPRNFVWGGNEPNIHYPFMFSAAGRQDLACKYLREHLRMNFWNAPDGMNGNDDGGTMSAFFVFSALGFYPVAGENIYYVACPMFDELTATLENGKKIRVVAAGASDKTTMPAETYVNGKKLAEPVIYFDDIKNGAEIRFVMQPTSSK